MSRLIESTLTGKISKALLERAHSKYCPRCGGIMNEFPAISRYDNETEICSDCGTDEAMMEYTGESLYDPHVYNPDTGKKLNESTLNESRPGYFNAERIADFLMSYDPYEFRNSIEGEDDYAKKGNLIVAIETDNGKSAEEYIRNIIDNNEGTEEQIEKAKEMLKLFESDKSEIENRIGELKQAIKDGVSDDEKEEMEKEITELENKLNESASNKEYELIHADSDKISELENGSAFTWEGITTTDDDLKGITEFFKENTKGFKTPVKMYTWSGKEFNDKYGLTGNNAYPDDLTFLSIPLDSWSEMGNLPMIKFQVGARWLDDIVDNNASREGSLDECDKPFKVNEIKDLNECDKPLKEDSYEEGIFAAIEEALYDAGFSIDRFTDTGTLTHNIGWDVSKDGESTQLQCNGSYLSESDDAKRGNESIDELKLHLEDLKSTIEEEGSVDEQLLKTKIEEMLNLLDGYKAEMKDSLKESIDEDADYFVMSTVEENMNKAFEQIDKKYDLGIGYDEYFCTRMCEDIEEEILNWLNEHSENDELDESNKLKESVEGNDAFWNKGVKAGDRLETKGAGTVTIMDINKPKNYIIVKRATDYQPFVAAWNPELDGENLTWGQGHYFNKLDDAQAYLNNLKESVNVVTSDGSTVDTDDAASVAVNNNTVSVTNGQTTVTITSTPELPVETIDTEVEMQDEINEPAEVQDAIDEPVEEVIADTEEIENVDEEPVEEKEIVEEADESFEDEEIEDIEEPISDDNEFEDGNEEIVDAKSLAVIKNQGNVYMIQLNGEDTYYVCDNFDINKNEGENASLYNSKEEADADYFERVGLQPVEDEEIEVDKTEIEDEEE